MTAASALIARVTLTRPLQLAAAHLAACSAPGSNTCKLAFLAGQIVSLDDEAPEGSATQSLIGLV